MRVRHPGVAIRTVCEATTFHVRDAMEGSDESIRPRCGWGYDPFDWTLAGPSAVRHGHPMKSTSPRRTETISNGAHRLDEGMVPG
jgi:hypothetical protein